VRKSRKILFSVLLLTIFLTMAILPITRAEESGVSQSAPAADEMRVYFIRESAMYGAVRHIWVACDEKVIASIGSGNYCCFKVKTGPSIINVVQAKTPAGFYLVKFRPGETVYLLYKITKGTITEVTPDVGEKYLAKTKEALLNEEANPNDAYEFSLINPGFFGEELMKSTRETINPDSEEAVITFTRPGSLFKIAPFGIWDEDGYLGTLKAKTYFQVKVKPGKHFFIGKARDFSVVEADVEAGKQYYIEFKASMSWLFANIKLEPIKKGEDDILPELLKGSLVTYDESKVSDNLKALMDKSKVVVDGVLKKVANGEIEASKLSIEDGR
jgi:hypothetical protein